MKFGVCTDATKAKMLAEAGFDYVEVYLTTVIEADTNRYAEMEDALAQANIQADAACLFLPGSLRLTGPEVDLQAVEAYLSTCFDRVSTFGTKIQVFGSGGARQVPDGWAQEKAITQLVEFLQLASRYAAKYGIQIAIEPLQPNDCNIINTVAEGLALAKLVDRPNVGVLADWYHMGCQSEGVAGILAAGPQLIHCHIARPDGRTYPLPDDGEDYAVFFDALRRIGYHGAMSIEAGGADEDLARSLAYIKTLA